MARAVIPGKARKLKRWKCQGILEQDLRARGFEFIAGADEVGRGSLFGAVVARVSERRFAGFSAEALDPRDIEHPQFPWTFQRYLYDCLHDYLIEMFIRTPQTRVVEP